MLAGAVVRSEEHTSELQSHEHLVCRLLLEKKKGALESRLKSPPDSQISNVVSERGVYAGVRAAVKVDLCTSALSRRLSANAFFFLNDPATTEISTLSLHDALPI